MKEGDRVILDSVIVQIARLQVTAKALGLEYLGALLEHAREEAMEQSRDDALARHDRARSAAGTTDNVVRFRRLKS